MRCFGIPDGGPRAQDAQERLVSSGIVVNPQDFFCSHLRRMT